MVEHVVGQPSAAHGVADHLRHTEERGLERGCAGRDERDVSVGEELVGAIEDDLRQRVPPAEATSVVVHRQSRRTGHDRPQRGETARHVEHGRQILRDLVPSAAGQNGQQRPTVVRHGRDSGHGAASEVLHGVDRRVADVIDGVVQRAIEVRLEGQDAEHAIDRAADGVYAAALPSPDLGRDVVADGRPERVVHIAGDAEVEAGIVDGDNYVGAPGTDVVAAEAHVAGDDTRVEHHGDDAHVGHLAVVHDACPPDGAHEVAAEEAELRLRIFVAQRRHQVRGVQVAGCFAGNEVVFHLL